MGDYYSKIPQIPQTGWLNNRQLCLLALEAGRCKIKVPTDSVSLVRVVSWLAHGHLLLYVHLAERERER